MAHSLKGPTNIWARQLWLTALPQTLPETSIPNLRIQLLDGFPNTFLYPVVPNPFL